MIPPIVFTTCPTCRTEYNKHIESEEYQLPPGRCPFCYDDHLTPYTAIGGIMAGILVIGGVGILLLADGGIWDVIVVLATFMISLWILRP